MTAKEIKPSIPILYSCYAQKSRDGEQFIPNHVFGCLLSGSSEVYLAGETAYFETGDVRFFKRNQLAKYVKEPPHGGEYQSVSITMDQETLRSMSEELNLKMDRPEKADNLIKFKPNALFKAYFQSLMPYLGGSLQLSRELTALKVKEAVLILLEAYPSMKNILFDFAAPGKIDLEAYMNNNYKYNVDLERFAYLTGRSLASFKRDFEKIYHSSPSKWLQQKRLEEAHYLISKKGKVASDVYLEVGFEDLSHFSFAFKKAYGVAPSKI